MPAGLGEGRLEGFGLAGLHGDEGAFKLAAGGILTYSADDGIGMEAVISIAETRRGELYIAGRLEMEGFHVGFRSGDGFRAIAPRAEFRDAPALFKRR